MPETPSAETQGRKRSSGEIWFWAAALFVLAVCVVIAPRVYLRADFDVYWLPWARSTGGVAPWRVYQRTFPTEVGERGCNYAPLFPYLLTLAEAARRMVGAPQSGGFAVFAVKFPLLLAHLGGAAVLRYGLRRPFGAQAAATAGWLYLFCPPLLYNAAVWGQADGLLSLVILGAVVALLHQRVLLCGALLGLALTLKPQTAALVPVLFLYVRRVHGPDRTLGAMLSALGTAAVVALPYVVAGAGAGMWAGTTGGMDYYPFRQVNMGNFWYLLDWLQPALSGSRIFGLVWDFEPLLGPIKAKDIGLLLLAITTVLICVTLWRRIPAFAEGSEKPLHDPTYQWPAPKPNVPLDRASVPLDRVAPAAQRVLTRGEAATRSNGTLVVGALILSAFAFVMLPTQMHGRYLLPGVALAALAWPVLPWTRPLFVVWCVTLILEQWMVLHWGHHVLADRSAVPLMSAWALLGLACAVVHSALFVYSAFGFARSRYSETLPR